MPKPFQRSVSDPSSIKELVITCGRLTRSADFCMDACVFHVKILAYLTRHHMAQACFLQRYCQVMQVLKIDAEWHAWRTASAPVQRHAAWSADHHITLRVLTIADMCWQVAVTPAMHSFISVVGVSSFTGLLPETQDRCRWTTARASAWPEDDTTAIHGRYDLAVFASCVATDQVKPDTPQSAVCTVQVLKHLSMGG